MSRGGEGPGGGDGGRPVAPEEELRFLLAAVQQSTEGLAVGDLDGNLMFVNPAFAEMHGYETEELLGRNLAIFHTPEQMPAVQEANRVLREKGRFEGEIWHARRDGTVFPTLMRNTLLRGTDGRAFGMIGTLVDISELKDAQERERQRREELARVSRVATVGEMASGLAHEISQPLTAISNYAWTCAEKLRSTRQDSEELSVMLEKISEQAHRASEIVSRIRRMVRKQPLSPGKTDMRSIVEEVLTFEEHELRRSGIPVELDVPEELPHVLVDRVEIEQVLINLMHNAVEAMERETMRSDPLLRISVAREGEKGIVVSITDRGPGFDPGNAEQMFKPFVTTKTGGLGIGLSISRTIIEAHGGRLWAEIADGGGATFSFYLPVG